MFEAPSNERARSGPFGVRIGAPLRPGLALFGLLSLAAGLTGLAAVAIAVYGASDACSAWAMRLGLAGSLLASAVSQALVLVGGWALWRATRPSGRAA